MLVAAAQILAVCAMLTLPSGAHFKSDSTEQTNGSEHEDSISRFDGLSLVAFEGTAERDIVRVLWPERPDFVDECRATPLASEVHGWPCTVATLTKRQLSALANLYPHRVFTSDFGAQLRSSAVPSLAIGDDRLARRQATKPVVEGIDVVRARVASHVCVLACG